MKIFKILILSLVVLSMNIFTISLLYAQNKPSSPTTPVQKTTVTGCGPSTDKSYQICYGADSSGKAIGDKNVVSDYICKNSSGIDIKVSECTVGGIFDVNDPEDVKCACCGDCNFSRFLGLGILISKWILGLSGTAALIVVIYGGLLWMFSAGKPELVEKGRKALTGAVIGVIIVLGAWLFINLILSVLLSDTMKENANGKYIDKLQSNFKADKAK